MLSKILKKQNIYTLNDKIKLDDLLDVIIKTKNKAQYITRHFDATDLETIDNHQYISHDKFINILKSAKSKDAKIILEKLENTEKNEIIQINLLDIKNNVITYNGIIIDVIINNNGCIWFKAKDVAKILNYENTKQAINMHIESEDKITFEKLEQLFWGLIISPQKSQKSNTIFINESELYSLIFGSKKEEAKLFKNWVTS